MSLDWEDREIRFDLAFTELRLKLGERILDRLENIEDTKGNGGDKGRLIVTNIRILWHSITSPRINISIGFDAMVVINTRVVNSKLKGTTQAMTILTSLNKTRLEFIFTNLVPGSVRHFTSVIGVHKAFVSSRLYRQLKLRGAIIHNKQLKMLAGEQIFSTVTGIWNLSSEQGNLGTFIVTNIRAVWYADMNEGFNISLPYLQIEYIKIRDSKFGTALVISSSKRSGSYMLGFRIDPEEKMRQLHKELCSLHAIYMKSPIFGVKFKEPPQKVTTAANTNLFDDADVVEEATGEMCNTLAMYLVEDVGDDTGGAKDTRPVYSAELGLAVESLKDGFTLQKLWEVIPS